ncbi:MAG: hypothetical protein GC159_01200 [Phycisphaera sp.]|nr:hypothetical protein [Phycisphaera sp.]
MNDRESSGVVTTIVVLVGGGFVFMLVLAVLLFTGMRSSSSMSATPTPTAPTTTASSAVSPTPGGVDYTVTPVSITRNAAGGYVVEAEIAKTDDWNWDSVAIDQVAVIAGNNPALTARVVTPPPTKSVPDTFVVKIETDPIAPEATDAHLRFSLNIHMSKYLGATKGSSSRS